MSLKFIQLNYNTLNNSLYLALSKIQDILGRKIY
jgi:hypothetical protein